MKQHSKMGFTIIESMLFLAVTGLMVMAIFIGSTSSINRQRYRDSANSLQSIIQQQYSEVANVINSRGDNWQCDDGNIQESDSDGKPRGQTDCVLLGKIVRSEDGKRLQINNISGLMPVTQVDTNDIDIFNSTGYNAKVLDQGQVEYELDWQVEISKQADASQNQPFSLLIVRSPISGNIKTFFKYDYLQDMGIQNILIHDNIRDGLLCLNSKGLFSGDKLAVKIEAGAFNGSAIQVVSDGDCS